MTKKSTRMSSTSTTAALLGSSVEFVEKELVTTVSDLLKNVTHIADIFFPPAPPSTVVQDVVNISSSGAASQNITLSSFYTSNNNNSSSVPISDNVNDSSNAFTYENDQSNDNNYYVCHQNNFATDGCNRATDLNTNHNNNINNLTVFLNQFTELYLEFLRTSSVFLIFLFTLWLFNRYVFKSKFVSTFIQLLFSWTVVALLFPGIFSFFGLILLGRACVALYLRIRFIDKVTGLPSRFLAHQMDSTWAFEKYGSSSTCTGLYIIKGKCDMSKILGRMEQVMKLELNGQCMFDRMRYSLRSCLGYICWERLEDFQLSRQVKLISDKNPKLSPDVPMTEQDLFDELQRIHDQPFSDKNLSPWEILIIPKYIHGDDRNDHYALVFRIHHAIMDGVSTGNALYCMADKPFKFSIDPIDPLKVGRFTKFMAYFVSFFMIPIVTFKNLTLFEKSCIHGPTLTGKKTFTWSKPVKLTSLKELKNKTNSSVFAVLMTCLGGSVRKLFISKGEPVPKKITAAPPVAILPFPDRKPRNRFSIVLFPIEIGVADVLERLDAVYRAAKDLANSSDILANFYTMNLLGMMPLIFIKVLGYFAHATITLSNIPGPAEIATLFGNDPIVDVGAWVPVKNTIGIGMALFSYADRLRVTIIGDEACLTNKNDVVFLKDEFENELKDLATRVGMDEEGLFIENGHLN